MASANKDASLSRLYGLSYESKVYDYMKNMNIYEKSNNFIQRQTINIDMLTSLLYDKDVVEKIVNVIHNIDD